MTVVSPSGWKELLAAFITQTSSSVVYILQDPTLFLIATLHCNSES